MSDHQPNKNRQRPSVSFTLPREQVDYLDELAARNGRKRSGTLEDVITFFRGMDIDRVADGPLFERIVKGVGEGKEM